MTVAALNAWTLDELPPLNRGVLFDGADCQGLVDALRARALPLLAEDPAAYAPREAQQVTVPSPRSPRSSSSARASARTPWTRRHHGN